MGRKMAIAQAEKTSAAKAYAYQARRWVRAGFDGEMKVSLRSNVANIGETI
jgi:hypothetical protein